jgi:hypothetical protein
METTVKVEDFLRMEVSTTRIFKFCLWLPEFLFRISCFAAFALLQLQLTLEQ